MNVKALPLPRPPSPLPPQHAHQPNAHAAGVESSRPRSPCQQRSAVSSQGNKQRVCKYVTCKYVGYFCKDFRQACGSLNLIIKS